jgi:glycosyltransferase involved in cell wall biosynthesis
MRICVVCLGLGDVDKKPLIGGHENTVIRLCKELYTRGHEIVIITTPSLNFSDLQSKVISLKWGKIFSLPLSAPYGSLRYGLEFMLRALYKMKKLHNKEKFGIIHGHSGYPVLGLVTGICGKILNIPSVHTLYCAIPISGYKSLLNRFYLLPVDKIISLSKNTEQSLRMVGILQERIKIVPPMVDVSSFSLSGSGGEINKNFKLKSSCPLLLYVGDLTKTRGLDILIDALSIVAKQFPSTKLLMAVNMPLEKYERKKLEIKEKISSLGLDDDVIPLGIVNNMPQIMAASDIFIAPYTDIESIADYPVSILEAMAAGKSVIASKVGGIPEIIAHQKNGLLIRPNDPIVLADAIIYMLNNKEKTIKMGLKGAKLVSEKFKTEIVVDELERIYEEVILNYSGNRRH